MDYFNALGGELCILIFLLDYDIIMNIIKFCNVGGF